MRIRTIGLIGLVFITTGVFAHAGPVQVIDDRSAFAGHDFTVIDFETCCGGRPLVFDEGHFAEIRGDAYADLGVTLSSDYHLIVGNPIADAEFDAAHRLFGSPNNVLINSNFLDAAGSIRFDFANEINAMGLAVQHRITYPPVRLEAYAQSGELLGSIDFQGSLIDGTHSFPEAAYGFMGLYSPTVPIAYAIVYEGPTLFDDLHFGTIPEPATAGYIVPVLAIAAKCCRRQPA